MPGDCLGSNVTVLWYHLSHEQRKVIVTQVANFEAQLLRLRLPFIGRIFCDAMSDEPDLSHSLRKFPLSDPGYFIGSLGHPIMNEDKFDMRDVGPWATSADYIRASIENQLTYVTAQPLQCQLIRQKRFQMTGKEDDPSAIPYFQAVLERLLGSFRSFLKDPHFHLLSDPTSPHFTIHHPDISVTNIVISYDDTTDVTGIIDWEGSAVLPIWSEPTGQRLLGTEESDVELQCIRRQILYDQVPDYERIRSLANEASLDYFTRIIQYNAVTWMTRPAFNNLFSGWIEDIDGPYQHYFGDLKQFLGTGKRHVTQIIFRLLTTTTWKI